MGIDGIALLRVSADALARCGVPRSRLNPLIDATLVYSGAPFGAEPDEHGIALRHLLGEALDLHDDPRGVLIIPDVAEVMGTRYEAVVAEVDEAGVWAPIVTADAIPARYTEAPGGSIEQLIGAAMMAMGGELRGEIQRAMASGDPSRLAGLEARMAEAFGGEEAMEALARRLRGALERSTAADDEDDEEAGHGRTHEAASPDHDRGPRASSSDAAPAGRPSGGTPADGKRR
jgi:hypothetical protein